MELELEPNEIKVFEDEETGYVLTEQPDAFDPDTSVFIVYDEFGNYVDEFTDQVLTDDERKDANAFKDTYVYNTFKSIADSFGSMGIWRDSDSFDWYKDYKPKTLTPEEQKAKAEEEAKLVESLCKSDTIVFHQTDPTTVMLDPIYAGKGFDVYKGSEWSGPLSKESIHELIRRHDRIVCLGHGTPSGLLSGVIGAEEVPLLKDKKIFSMWCYAATFWKKHGFEGHGILTSDNFPSEVWECRAACDAEVSKEWIFDNMMLAGEIAGRAMDIAWDNPQAGCDLFRKEYSEQSEITTEDERKVVEFNTNSMQVV